MEEGVAIFTAEEELILSNEAFIQNANLLSNRTVNSPEQALQIRDLQPVVSQIRDYIRERSNLLFEEEHFKEIICQKQNRYFLVRGNLFSDLSFELIIKNVTKSEKSKYRILGWKSQEFLYP
jgi:hypothetical protein